MKSNEEKMAALIRKLKSLRTHRKALAKAEREDKTDDVATITMKILKAEEWFATNHPDLDIGSVKSLNATLKVKEAELKILMPPAAKKVRETATSTANMTPAGNGRGATQTSETRRKPATKKRHPRQLATRTAQA